jgi:hypothetical protein
VKTSYDFMSEVNTMRYTTLAYKSQVRPSHQAYAMFYAELKKHRKETNQSSWL